MSTVGWSGQGGAVVARRVLRQPRLGHWYLCQVGGPSPGTRSSTMG